MQRYESYKSSAIPWIDELPQHWGEEKGKWLHRFRKDLNNRKQCDNVLSLTLRGVVNNDPDDPEGLVPKDYGTYQIFEKNDLVFKLIDLENFRTSRVGLVHERGIMSPAYLRVQPGKKHNPRYFYYYYFTLYQQGIYNKLGAGVRSTLGPTDLLEIGVPVPSKDEQDRIVAFLDQKAAEIDAAIVKKERLIELIKEQKSTCIEKAITEGLEAPKNSEACLSPKHWSRIKLKYCINLLPGFAFKSSSYSSNDSDIPLLRGVNVNPGKLNWEDKVSWPKASLAPHLKYMLEPGDLVIGMDRPWVADGIRVAPVQACDLPCLLLQRVARLRAANRITQEFLALVLTSRGFLTYFEPMLTGISVPHISPEQIGNYEATLPPVEEQEAICKFVSQLSRFCEQAIAKETQIVNGLRQLRASVIADVVLGKRKI